MVYLTGVDQIVALLAADVDAIPLAFIECVSGNGQSLALRAGFLDPVVSSAARIHAVANLRNDAFKPELAGVREHLAPLDLEAFAELHVGPGDDLLQFGLALEELQLSQVSAVQVEQVEGDQYYPGRGALEFVLQH